MTSPPPAGTSPARAAFESAALYLCTDARRRQGDLVDFLDAALAGGVDVVQLREKGLEARDELRFLEVFADAAQRHGRLWAVNDRADIALAAGTPILHLGQDDLGVPVARRILGDEVIIGRSTHSPAQFDAGYDEPGVDYVCAGPTWTTPTKLGRPAAGLSLLSHAASVAGSVAGSAGRSEARSAGGSAAGYAVRSETGSAAGARPWFAIGGIENLDRLDEVIASGARRVVVVRAITEADDPAAAAKAFADRLAQIKT